MELVCVCVCVHVCVCVNHFVDDIAQIKLQTQTPKISKKCLEQT